MPADGEKDCFGKLKDLSQLGVSTGGLYHTTFEHTYLHAARPDSEMYWQGSRLMLESAPKQRGD